MDKQRNWWESRSAADDGLEIEDEKDDWFDGFDFNEFADDEGGDYVGGLWNRYGSHASLDKTERVVTAQKLVQGFVDTFATGDRPYRVVFDESVKTAGTDFNARVVVVSHAPLFDPTITQPQAHTVLTAMAAHEASHVRYGRRTAAAVEKEYPTNALAKRVGNVLDDVRIERRFVADYPGYRDVFAPAIDYVAKGQLGDNLLDPGAVDATNLMVAAVRYTHHVAWTPETIGERDYWTDWAARYTATDRATDHVAGVAEALVHLANAPQPQKPDPKPQDGEASGGTGSDEGASDQPTGPAGNPAPSESGTEPTFPECFADAVLDTATSNASDAGSSYEAQAAVEAGKALVSIGRDSDWGKGEIYWSPSGVAVRRPTFQSPSASAAAYIRRAFTRSRTGHYEVSRGQRHGRLDNRSLGRIAERETRLFTKRIAPSEGRYRVWYMVDCSSSMGGYPIRDAISTAQALAAASRFLPNVTLEVWGWTSGMKLGAGWGAVKVWESGDPIANIAYLAGIKMGGTPDAAVVTWAAKAIKTVARPDETPLIILASDGAGYLSQAIIDKTRKSGVGVVSVALGGISAEHQARTFGEGNYIAWKGTIAATARPLGDLLARVAGGRA